MDRETSRRALLAAALGGGIAGGLLSPAGSYLDRFAPLSGSTWTAARAGRRSEVSNPYGPAAVRYDDDGVPHVTGDTEEALYFAVGYAQATDRLFQLDVQRRLIGGRLSELVGEVAVGSDTFYRKLHFQDAAEATVDHLRTSGNPAVVAAVDAYTEGVNRAMELETLPLEYHLMEIDPAPWTVADSMLIEKLIAWGLTGSFRTLRKAVVRDRFDDDLAEQLYPARFEDVTPIIREFHDAGELGPVASQGRATGQRTSKGLVDWMTSFEPPGSLGSNSWLVSADLAAGDAPMLSNDPHLQLQSPPIWYEMHLDGPDHRVRGVTFPGVPFVVIGENEYGTWGFTNSNADSIDFYTYETADDGRTYEYGDEHRAFDVETEEIPVAGGENVEIERKRSVHGPVVEEGDHEVGVAWTGHAATETTVAVYELTHSEGVEDAISAIEKFEVPSQNFLYADRAGNTRYQLTGRIPIRRTDGERVPGDRIFDGSAPEGEWDGFTPFDRPTWDGFLPFSENPRVVDPDYVATANQRIISDDQVGFYLAGGYSSPYRGERIYDLLEDRIESGDSFDGPAMRAIGRDTYDGRAAAMTEALVEAARERDEEDLQSAATLLADWDHHMEADSRGALLFQVWIEEYRSAIFDEPFDKEDLGREYHPSDGAIERLPPDSRWFGPGGRAPVMRAALRSALERIDEEGLAVYGDLSHSGVIGHSLGLDFLGYPKLPRSGSGDTVWNFNYRGPWGAGWAMHVDLDGEYRAILAGGNSGRYFSDHYHDQLERWVNGDFRTLSRTIEGDLVTRFTEDS